MRVSKLQCLYCYHRHPQIQLGTESWYDPKNQADPDVCKQPGTPLSILIKEMPALVPTSAPSSGTTK